MENKSKIQHLQTWNLCEYGISVIQVKMLFDKGIYAQELSTMSAYELNQKFGRNVNALYQKIQTALQMGFLESLDRLSVYSLNSENLSEGIIKKCIAQNITIMELMFLEINDLISEYTFSFGTANKCKIAASKMLTDMSLYLYKGFQLSNTLVSRRLLEHFANKTLNYLAIKRKCKIKDLRVLFPKVEFQKSLMGLALQELVEERLVIQKEEELILCEEKEELHDLEWFVNTISDRNKRKILERKIEGQTLEEIGQEQNGISRERVRQILRKLLCNKPPLEEDRYRFIFERYDLPKEEFCKIFEVSPKVYNYLSIHSRRGKRPMEEILEDIEIDESARKRAVPIIYKNYFIGENYLFPMRKQEVVKYIVRTYCKETKTYREVHSMYDAFISANVKENRKSWKMTETYFDNAVVEVTNALISYGKKVRYYDMNLYDFERLVDILGLKDLHNAMFSTLKFFRDFPEIMREYDIHNEYELHNLLKKIYGKKNSSDLNFSRMPYIEFGKVNRDSIAYEALLEKAPISVEGLANYFTQQYGILPQTARANHFKGIEKYLVNGMYQINLKPFTKQQREGLKCYLKNDFYFISDVKEEFYRLFPDADSALINSYNLSNLGFKVYDQFIIRSSFANSEVYFLDLFTKEEIIDTTKLDPRYKSIGVYYTNILHLRERYELFEYKKGVFIHIRKLNQMGITKEMLQDFATRVVEYEMDGYFSITSLRKAGFYHRILNLNFEDCFYNAILHNLPELKGVSFNNTVVFRRTTKRLSIVDFLEFLLKNLGVIEVNLLECILQETYGVKKDRNKLLWFISNSKLYYDKIMGCLYQDYEVYKNQFN